MLHRLLRAAWGWEKCVRLLLPLPHVHPLVADAQGVSPEEAARRVGFHQIADAIKVRAEELGVALPERAFWDEPDKRFYVKEPEPRRPRRSPTTRRTWSECVVAVPNPRPW